MDDLTMAVILTSRVYEGLFNDKGVHQLEHPLRVMRNLADEWKGVLDPQDLDKLLAAALLHDVLEDTFIRFDDLCQLGLSDEVLEVVRLMTKTPADCGAFSASQKEKKKLYLAYVRRIAASRNFFAIEVKKADLKDRILRGSSKKKREQRVQASAYLDSLDNARQQELKSKPEQEMKSEPELVGTY